MVLWAATSKTAYQLDRVQLHDDGSWTQQQWMAAQGRVGLQWQASGPRPTFRPMKSSTRFQVLPWYRLTYFHSMSIDPWSVGHQSAAGPWGSDVVWFWGIELGRYSIDAPGLTDRIIWLPFWLLAAVSLPLPTVSLVRWIRNRRRRRPGRCTACGYDLRAATDRCPECGMPVPQKVRATA